MATITAVGLPMAGRVRFTVSASAVPGREL